MSAQKDSTPDTVAQLRAKIEKEPIASFLKMRLLELSRGYARVAMNMRADYGNFNGVVFGGIIFMLSDFAAGYASNTIISPNVASQFNIHFIASAYVGDELTAECRVVKSGRRVCISEVTVTNQESKLIARATSTTIPVVDRNGD